MDYVDILYIHDIRNPEMLEYKPIINAVKKLKKEGKIKFIGFSTHANEPAVINLAFFFKLFKRIIGLYSSISGFLIS